MEEGEQAEKGEDSGAVTTSSPMLKGVPPKETFHLNKNSVLAVQIQVQGKVPRLPLPSSVPPECPHIEIREPPLFRWCQERLASRGALGAPSQGTLCFQTGGSRLTITHVHVGKDTHKVLRIRHHRATCVCPHAHTCTHTCAHTLACTQPHTYSRRWAVLPLLSTCSGG